jgi:rubredoxin
MMCPQCGSDNVRVGDYDFGRCPETGYHDAGERYECLICGSNGEATELVTEETSHAA